MSSPSILTHYSIPPVSTDLLRRERLTDFLHEQIARRLIVVAAPAGYGKTSLLADFARDTDLAVCWYSLAPSDGDPSVFLEHLLTSLASRFPGFGEKTREVLAAVSPYSDPLAVAGALVNEMVSAIPEWFVLVFDDFHHVEESPPIARLLSSLLAHQPEHCHLILSSRTVPQSLPLASLVTRGAAVTLGPEALRFTAREVEALFCRSGRRISPQEAERLTNDTEGWITAIRLTGDLWRQAWSGPLQEPLPAGLLYDYLASEVLEHQEAELQQFLLSSSTLTELTAETCQQALGLEEAAHWLREAERHNLFITRTEGGEDRWRYHVLFREFLQARLREVSPETFSRLHRQAAAWFAVQGLPERAVEHYLTAGAVAEAAQTMDRVAPELLRVGHLQTLVNWTERLPEETLQTVPSLLLCAAKAASRIGCLEQTERWLEMAKGVFRTEGDGGALGMALSAQALVRLNQGRYAESLRLTEEALSLISSNGEETTEAAIESHRVQAACLMHLGRFVEAHQRFQEALERSQAAGVLDRELLIREGLAWCLHCQGQLEEAIPLYDTVIAACRRLGRSAQLSGVLNDLAYNLYLLGQYDAALQAVRQSVEVARSIGHRYMEAVARVSLGEMVRDLGDPLAAIAHIEGGLEIAEQLDVAFLRICAREALAVASLCLGDSRRAVALSRAAVELADGQKAETMAGRCRATLGLAQVENGAIGEGLLNLEKACASLGQSEAAPELARARLFLAASLWRIGEQERAAALLEQVFSAYSGGGEHRLLVEGRPVLSSLREMVAHGVGENGWAVLLIEGEDAWARALEAFRQREKPPTPLPLLRAYGFGVGRVERDGEMIPQARWRTAVARHLFFYALSHPPRSREQIGADMWPDLASSRLSGTFHNTRYRMQQALGVNPMSYQDGLYTLREDLEVWYDVREFERLLDRAAGQPACRAIRDLRRAVALYRGDFLEDCYADWCVIRREALRARFLDALGRLVDILLERGQTDEVVGLLGRGLEVDPFHEGFHRRMMRAYALAGRADAAVAHYRHFARFLWKELGIEPEPETRALLAAIREGTFPPENPPGAPTVHSRW